MSQQTTALILGGVLPALMFGFSNILTKVSISGGMSTSAYITIVGIAVTLVGIISGFTAEQHFIANFQSTFSALCVGITWALGQLMIAIAIQKFSVPLSVISPIYNSNTLVAVLIALIIFNEWTQVSMIWLCAGSFLTTIGSILVARSLI
ncbi:hypothetical protein RGRSB_1295 [cyanobacterium endosymbiont of Rhopalodia gibberula]|uniref:hypothetical protein n=1 Tax=cyanobacterium endosymbiont of Rhopalodia gibberula TaxID=1763363 RepID=UPI000DC6FB88|nr:hypothetical protein [cyanobacterium endosymbiont of Rhopalodia gibberula]BBA79746.1 hypothetical protein RGRSB_1295 [cyanobacterium endosymbiont of Rhopalodia gibberula]